jgi:hypothetical protein
LLSTLPVLAVEGPQIVLDVQVVDEGDRQITYQRIATPDLLPQPSPAESAAPENNGQNETDSFSEPAAEPHPAFAFLDFYLLPPEHGWFRFDLSAAEETVRISSRVDFSHFQALGEVTMGTTVFHLSIFDFWATPPENNLSITNGAASALPSKTVPTKHQARRQWFAHGPVSPRLGKLLDLLHDYYASHGAELAAESAYLREQARQAAEDAAHESASPEKADSTITFFPIPKEANQ